MPVSLVFNGAMAVVAGLYRMRRKEERAALQQTAAALQVVKESLSSEARKTLSMANDLAQSPISQGVIRAIKAQSDTQDIIKNVSSAITVK